MKLNFIVTCEHAFADSEQRISIIQVFNTIKAKSFPVIHPKLTVVTHYTLEDKELGGTFSQSIEVFDPAGKRMADIALDFTGKERNVQTIGYFYNLPIGVEGTYKIRVDVDGKTVKELNLEVIKEH